MGYSRTLFAAVAGLMVGCQLDLSDVLSSFSPSELNKWTREATTSQPGPVEEEKAKEVLKLKHGVKKTSGEDWAMWDGLAPLRTPWTMNSTCHWAKFRSSTGKEGKMCIHPPQTDRIVSRSIVSKGRWADCDALTEEWMEKDDASLFIDIGSNIGSCAMELLMSTNASIIAFEPQPANQFCFTSTLVELGQEYVDRVSYFPIALGERAGQSTIHAAEGNYGNSVVGTEIQDFVQQQFRAAIPIRIERLDDILDASSSSSSLLDVGLMKLDAQGLECKVMDGMPEVLKRTATIHTELANKWLRGQGCSDVQYLDKLRQAEFETFLLGGGTKTLLTPDKPPHKGILSVLATKQKEGSFAKEM